MVGESFRSEGGVDFDLHTRVDLFFLLDGLPPLPSVDPRYSVFTVEQVVWASDPDESHRVVLRAAIDNRREPEDLELCPWY